MFSLKLRFHLITIRVFRLCRAYVDVTTFKNDKTAKLHRQLIGMNTVNLSAIIKVIFALPTENICVSVK